MDSGPGSFFVSAHAAFSLTCKTLAISQKSRSISEKVQESSSSHLIKEKTAETNEAAQSKTTEPSPETQEVSEEESSQAAFNPVTGEINWDCPCLGGMAHGPCGPEFREAFSCFVYSEEEPKGINCVEKFKGMQDCFRLHPEVYGEGKDIPQPCMVRWITPSCCIEILEEDSDEDPSDLNEATPPSKTESEESTTPSPAS